MLGLPVLATGRTQSGSARAVAAVSEVTAHQLLSGNERGVVKKGHSIVRSPRQLETLLRQIYAGQVPPPAPNIDFLQQVLVYYTTGTGMHGGDRVYIRSGALERGILHVKVEIATSGANCLGTSGLTAPFALAALPFPAQRVRRADFEITHESYSCK